MRCRRTTLLSKKKRYLAVFWISFNWQRGPTKKKEEITISKNLPQTVLCINRTANECYDFIQIYVSITYLSVVLNLVKTYGLLLELGRITTLALCRKSPINFHQFCLTGIPNMGWLELIIKVFWKKESQEFMKKKYSWFAAIFLCSFLSWEILTSDRFLIISVCFLNLSHWLMTSHFLKFPQISQVFLILWQFLIIGYCM